MLTEKQPRHAAYEEFLELVSITRDETSSGKVCICKLGAYHQVRWMAKAI